MSERLFLDTNVFIASITKEKERVEVAKELLNSDYEFYTSLLNLLELRTVLAKKKRLEQSQVEKAIEQISEEVEIFVHETSDVLATNKLQQETLRYPMDCLILAAARDADAELVTFDREMLDNGATSPSEILDEE